MSLELVKGASIADVEVAKVNDALAALAKDPHAPRELSVPVTLHVYNEYPKHVPAGEDKDGNPVTKIVNSAAEEKTALAPVIPIAQPPAAPVADDPAGSE